jgi:hypothetical protein
MTHRTEWLKRNGFDVSKSYSLNQLSQMSKVSINDLRSIFNRGVGARKTNPASVRLKGSFKKDPSKPLSMKLSGKQWAMARIYSFLNKIDLIKMGKLKEIDQDKDIAVKYIK